MSGFDLTEMERLDGAVVRYWRVRTLFNAILATLFLAGPAILFADYRAWIFGILAIVVALIIVTAIFLPGARYERYRFSVDANELRLHSGVVQTVELVIPIARLQHVDLSRNVFQRAFGLASLIVHTAGGSNATFSLPGLAVARAEQLRDQILMRLPESVRRPVATVTDHQSPTDHQPPTDVANYES